MNGEDIYAGDDAYQARMFDELKRIGVTVVRQNFRWGYTAPAPGVYDWVKLDRYVLAAAKRGIRVLPLVYGETPWGTSRPPGHEKDNCTYPPRNNADFAEFARQIAARYGRGGLFWQMWPKYGEAAVTAYEIWNEPNLKRFWACKPDAEDFVALGRATTQAIKTVDPEATLISAGAPKKDVDTGKYFHAMFKAGARKVFNALGLHSYEPHSQDMVDELYLARDALDDKGADEWSLYLTEWGWATGGPPSDHTLTESKQATAISNALKYFGEDRKKLKLKSVQYYSWTDLPPPPGAEDSWGLNTGLLRENLTAKPGLDAFAKAAKKIK